MSIDDGLRPLIREHLPTVDWQSIESGLTGQGIPDLSGAHPDCGDFWVECKATSAWSVSVRVEQVAWAERRIRHGGRVFLAVRRRHDGGLRKGPAVDELWLYWGGHTRHVRRHGLGNPDAGVTYVASPLLVERGGPSRWDWSRVLDSLTTYRVRS